MTAMQTNIIIETRERIGLTQAEVGARLGVPQSTICRWERNPERLKVENLCRLAAALGVDPEKLVGAGRPCVPCGVAS